MLDLRVGGLGAMVGFVGDVLDLDGGRLIS